MKIELRGRNLYQARLLKPEGKASPLPLTRCNWYRPCPEGHQ